MSDLIESLEEATEWDDRPSWLIHEAIARIAALEAQLAELEAENERINAGWDHTSKMLGAANARAYEAEKALLSALEAPPAPIVNRPTHCGGCGETDPAKRCIGCLADFGPASHQQQETADADH